jgi:hypothetical protein
MCCIPKMNTSRLFRSRPCPLPEIVGEDCPMDAYGSRFSASNVQISKGKASLEHTDPCLKAASEALESFEPGGVLLFLFLPG